MIVNILKSKIHRATVTQANVHYVGSITIDEALMQAAGLYEYEQVLVADVDNGNRLITYVIHGPKGKGDICLNGAAARLMNIGDKIIIMSFCQLSKEELKTHKPKIVFVDDKNKKNEISVFEKHGEIK